MMSSSSPLQDSVENVLSSQKAQVKAVYRWYWERFHCTFIDMHCWFDIILQSVIPYIILQLLFVIMWWCRDINISNDDPQGMNGNNTLVLFFPEQGPDSSCGWPSMYYSLSGRLQECFRFSSFTCLFKLLDIYLKNTNYCCYKFLFATFIISNSGRVTLFSGGSCHLWSSESIKAGFYWGFALSKHAPDDVLRLNIISNLSIKKPLRND